MGLQWGGILRAWNLTPAEWGALGDAAQQFTAAWWHSRRAQLAASDEHAAGTGTGAGGGAGLTPAQEAHLRQLQNGGVPGGL